MAYRSTQVSTVVAGDSNLRPKMFDGSASIYQGADLKVFTGFVQVAPADAEALIPITPVVNGYFIHLQSDYPVQVRINGVSATQFVMHSNNVASTNVGSPLPPQCVFLMTAAITSLRLAPITAAAQTANVLISVTGDPSSSYV